jgi:hypothetical protein
MLNEVDPLPTALGAKVKPLNRNPLTEQETKALQLMAFEKSRWYDVVHAMNTAALDRYASHPYFCL